MTLTMFALMNEQRNGSFCCDIQRSPHLPLGLSDCESKLWLSSPIQEIWSANNYLEFPGQALLCIFIFLVHTCSARLEKKFWTCSDYASLQKNLMTLQNPHHNCITHIHIHHLFIYTATQVNLKKLLIQCI